MTPLLVHTQPQQGQTRSANPFPAIPNVQGVGLTQGIESGFNSLQAENRRQQAAMEQCQRDMFYSQHSRLDNNLNAMKQRVLAL